MRIVFNTKSGLSDEDHTEFISFDKKIKITKSSIRGKVIIVPTDSQKRQYNVTLIKALIRCYFWHSLIQTGKCKTIADIQRFENLKDKKYIRKIMSIRFLPAQLQEDILNGTQDVDLSLKKLLKLC